MEKGLPVKGYTDQTADNVSMVNANKEIEERLLRRLDKMKNERSDLDGRWLAVARTHFEEGFMAMNRAVFKPQRVKLPEDDDLFKAPKDPYPTA